MRDKARCYHEFCCYPAEYAIIDYGNPEYPEFTYRGKWGYCRYHFPKNDYPNSPEYYLGFDK